ncbi:MAG: hypothetical protein ABI276_01155 [Acidimicrobiales bacterium]
MDADDEFAASVAALAADAAADERRRRRDLGAQDTLSATFAGVAIDLAERRSRLTVTTTGGRRHQGQIQSVGSDFIAVADANTIVYLPLVAVFAISVEGEGHRAPSNRMSRSGASLAIVLSELAADRPRVVVRAYTGPALSGMLVEVGDDVLRLRLDDAAGTVAYVALWSLAEVSVTGSG